MATIPLHLHPSDYSPAACRKRLMLHAEMAALNPNGFRKPAKSEFVRVKRKNFSGMKANRITSLDSLARLAGKDQVLGFFKRMGAPK